MNARLLLNALSLIGDDPDRVSQIRKIAVALAITGKLDSLAVSLRPAQIVESVDRVKAALVQRGSLPKQKQYAPVTHVDLPEAFTDPSMFAPLGEIARIEKGKTGIQQANPGSFPLVVTAAELASCDHFDFDGAAAIIPLVSSTGHGNASLNRLHYQEGKFALGTILAGVFPHDPTLISARFLFEYLSAFKDELLVTRMTGTANVTLTIGGIAEVPIPLVCPEVQKRVDELMVLCDRLEAARAEREATRDRLAASSLARLNAPDPETFQNDARFVLNALPALTTRPDQIKQLRQTILNLAVRGKLVPQDAKDEPAVELLKRIAKEKVELVKAGRLKKPEPVDNLIGADQSFPTPHGWVMSTLKSVCISVTDGDHLPPPKAESGIPFLVIGNVRSQRIEFAGSRFVPQEYYEALDPIRRPQCGDLLYTLVGSYGIPVVVRDDQPFCVQRHIGILRPSKFIDVSFLERTMGSRFAFNQATACATGIAQKTVSLFGLRNLVLPLPPLAEQHRIVAKVDELMALCDQLEASLTDTAATRSRLLDALLAEAMEPDEVREVEAVA